MRPMALAAHAGRLRTLETSEISNKRLSKEKEEKILGKLKEDYQGFGPTLASEKLSERDSVKVSKESVRQIMIEAGLHKLKTQKKDKANPLGQRRQRQGE